VVKDTPEGRVDVILVQKDVPVQALLTQAPYVSPVAHHGVDVVHGWLQRGSTPSFNIWALSLPVSTSNMVFYGLTIIHSFPFCMMMLMSAIIRPGLSTGWNGGSKGGGIFPPPSLISLSWCLCCCAYLDGFQTIPATKWARNWRQSCPWLVLIPLGYTLFD
jgi:hypothetical protein